MPSIFISHSSNDAKAADDVKALLARLGFERVFLDFDKDSGIGVGENWEKRLYEELTRCHAVVLVLTPNWLKSKWCFVELAQARALGKVILPIVCEPLGKRRVLPEIQSADILDWDAGGAERLEQRLRTISDELARGFALAPNRPPYPGIHAFEAEDAAIYFGRDDETRAVIEKLDARRRQGGGRFVIVIGASGSGKSSLLKAGVVAQLGRRRGQWIVLPTMRPEKTPLESLAKTLAYKAGEPAAWRTWHERLQGADALRHIGDLSKDLRVGETRGATLLLPIDQFEEVFTIAEPAERAAFLAVLAAILSQTHDLPIIAVATGRADVLQGLLETSEVALLTESVALPRMPLDRVPRLVDGPAAVAGILVEKGLSERVARDVESPEALPLLAYSLRLLHERSKDEKRLTLAEYDALGDPTLGLNPVQNSVRLAADQAIEGVNATEQELVALRDAFVPHLVRLRLDDATRVRQPAPLAALPREAERLIAALTDARLLSARVEGGEAVIEVAHESLFDAWPMLARWLDEEQAFLGDIERTKAAHQAWAQAPDAHKPQALLHGLLLGRARDWLVKHPQRFLGRGMEPLRAFIAASAEATDAERARSEGLRRRFVQAVAAAAIVFAGAAAVAGWQYVRAENARLAAQLSEVGALRARDRAAQNFDIAKQAANDVVFKLANGLRNVQGMRVESRRQILDTAQALMDQLARAAPDDLPLQRSRAMMFATFTDTYLDAGDMTRARAAADESLAIMRKVSAADPSNARWQRDLGASLDRVGDVRRAAGDRAGALAAHEESVAIMRKLLAADPFNEEWRRDLSAGLTKVGDAREILGDRPGALAAYEESLAIRRSLAAVEPGQADRQRDVSLSLERIGDVRLAEGDRAAALAAYEESLAIRRKLATADPGNMRWLRNLTVSLEKVGNARLADDDRAGALAAYEESLTIRRKLVATDPGNTEWQRDMYLSLVKVGDVRLADDDRTAALAAYEEGLAIMRKLAAADPSNTGWQRDVYLSLVKVGNVRLADGDRAGALAAYEESLAIMRKLVATDPGNAGWQRDMSISLNKVGDVRLADGDRAGALVAYEESLAIMRKLAATAPNNAGWQREVYLSLIKVGDLRLAAGDRAGALTAFEESLAIMRWLAAADPGNALSQRDVGVSLNKVGDLRLDSGDRVGARAAYEESLAIMRKLAAADPSDAGWQRDLSIGLNKVGDVRIADGDRAGALAAYEESLAVRRKLAADPGNAGWQIDLIISLYKVSTAAEPARARAMLREALAILDVLERQNKLTAAQRSWRKLFEDALAKLPPDEAQAR